MSHARSSLVKLGSYRLPNGGLLVLSQGSVVHFEGDAIVNAANEVMISRCFLIRDFNICRNV